MSEKCFICKSKIAELFLGKLKGTAIKKPGQSQSYYVCFECQKKLNNNKEEMLKYL